MSLCVRGSLKSIFYKKRLEKAVHPKNVQRTAPIFQANTHQNMGAVLCNFFGSTAYSSIFLHKMDFRFEPGNSFAKETNIYKVS